MNLSSFSRFFANLGLRRSEQKTPRRRRRQPVTRPTLEFLEDRTLLSSTPAAVVTNPNYTTFTGFDPQVAIDPLNSQFLVEVSTSGSGLVMETSINGGQTWTLIANGAGSGFGVNNGVVVDPTTLAANTLYPYVTSPSVSFDRDGHFYVVSNQFNANALTMASSASDLASGTTVAGASGAIVFDMFTFNASGTPTENNATLTTVNISGTTPTTTTTHFTNGYGNTTVSNQILYQWEGQDPAFNPTVAVDTNLPATEIAGPSFTDPVTGATQADTLAVSINPQTGAVEPSTTTGAVPLGIYVGWNINFTEPSGFTVAGVSTPTVSRIMIDASGDGGNNFTTAQYADTNTSGVGSAPEILFTQGSAIPTETWTLAAAAAQGATTITVNVNANETLPPAGAEIEFPGDGSTDTIASENTPVGTMDTWNLNAPLALAEAAGNTVTYTANTIPTVPGGQMNILYGDDTTFFVGHVASGESNAVIQQSQPNGGEGAAQTWNLSAALTTGNTTLTVTTTDDTTNGLAPPSTTNGPFIVTFSNGQSVTITATAGTTWTLQSAYTGTTEASGATLAYMPDVAAAATFQGTTGAVNDAEASTAQDFTLDNSYSAGANQITVSPSGPVPPVGTTITFPADGTTDKIASIVAVGLTSQTWDLTAGLTLGETVGTTVTFTPTTSTPVTTDFTVNVTSTAFPTDLTTIDDLEVTLDLAETEMNQVSIVLIPPSAALGTGTSATPLTPITLLSNATNDAGGSTSPQVGLANLANLGVAPGSVFNGTIRNIGTVFDDNAPRLITDSTATAPWVGFFKPTADDGPNGQITTNSTAPVNPNAAATGEMFQVDGLATDSTQVDGTWTLEITNYVSQTNNRNTTTQIGTLNGFWMHFTGLISTSSFGANADDGPTGTMADGDGARATRRRPRATPTTHETSGW